jgi:hypothetical protein
MNNDVKSKLAHFIWSIANDNLRNIYFSGRNRDELVLAFGDVPRILKQMSTPEWVDGFKG